jgi:hypothetical protein
MTKEEKKESRNEYIKQWRLDNKEHLKEYRKQYYSDPVNKERQKNLLKQWRLDNKEHVKEYWAEYYLDPVNKAKKESLAKQWRLDNKEHIAEYTKQYYSDPVNKARKEKWKLDNKEHVKEYLKNYNIQYYSDPVNKERQSLKQIKRRYGLTEEMYIKLYEEQGGLCLGCDIVLVSRIIGNEEDVIGIKGVDYADAHVDHDHGYDIEGKWSGDPDSVRGLLCPSCNGKDVLNPESRLYIFGVDGDLNKKELVMNREFIKQASDKGELK